MKIGLREILIVFLVLASLIGMASSYILQRRGVTVESVDENADCINLRVGDKITELDGEEIQNKKEFQDVLDDIPSGRRATMVVNGGPGGCNVIERGDIGVTVSDFSSRGIEFGTSISGGKIISVDIVSDLEEERKEQIFQILKRRVSALGLEETSVSYDEDFLIYAPEKVNINQLLIKGHLEGVIEQVPRLTNGTGDFKIGGYFYDISKDGEDVRIDGEIRELGSYFSLDDIDVKITNVTNSTATIHTLIFNNEGVSPIPDASGYVRYESSTRQYQFSVPVRMSEDASKRFAEITEGMAPLFGSDVEMLDGLLVYYLDGEEISRLSIPLNIAGEEMESISITGGTPTVSEAMRIRKMIDVALEGVIEEGVQQERIGSFDGSLNWLPWASAIIVMAIVLVFTFVGLARYNKDIVYIHGSILLISEIISIIGIATLSQLLLNPGWIIDTYSLVGIIILSFAALTQFLILSEKVIKNKRFKYNDKHLSIALIMAGFVIWFTPFNKMGSVFFLGSFVHILLTKPVYEKLLKFG